MITEWQDADGSLQKRDHSSDLGGTMRLGAQDCMLKDDSLIHDLYGKDMIDERHRHRYEFNNAYRDKLAQSGLVLSGTSVDGELVEVIELADHPWFVGCQFHPEFTSSPRDGHPLFKGFVLAAGAVHKQHVADEAGC
jgi:CTP synthase